MMGRDRRVVVAGSIGAVLVLAAAISVAAGVGESDFIVRKLEALRDFGLIGELVFVGLQMLTAVAGVLPASLLGIAAGAVYGVDIGFGLAASGLMLGAVIAFGLARTALRPAIQMLLNRRQAAGRFDHAVGREGWRLVLLLRISPVMPFSLTSYALGLSAVTLRDYVVGTVAALPALLAYVGIGAAGAEGIAATGAGGSVREALVVAGVTATLLLGLQVARLLLGARLPVSSS